MALYVARWCEPGIGNGVNERFREGGEISPAFPYYSARQIADETGIDHKTVLTLLRVWQSIPGHLWELPLGNKIETSNVM